MKTKIRSTVFIIMMVMMLLTVNASGHKGKTDSSGGHHDYGNVSGLGDYHYHHGYGPHLHPSGVCPYESGNFEESGKSAMSLLVDDDSTEEPEVKEVEGGKVIDWERKYQQEKAEKEKQKKENIKIIIMIAWVVINYILALIIGNKKGCIAVLIQIAIAAIVMYVIYVLFKV